MQLTITTRPNGWVWVTVRDGSEESPTTTVLYNGNIARENLSQQVSERVARWIMETN